MIHVVIGGSHSGKTTFVKQKFFSAFGPMQPYENKMWEVPVTINPLYGNTAIAIGHYLRPLRTCGVDQMGREYETVRWKVLRFLSLHGPDQFHHIAMEGNALMTRDFMDALKNCWLKDVKLWLMNPPGLEVQRRLEVTKVNYGTSIIALSYRRAFKIWADYKEVFAHEVVH